ncbi:MAG TPA: hypothetical protein VND97_04645 [Beijerinckiaceae bacterium]|nr:hypothetical protein [Beijerinckiaceae bacterium]
MFRPVGGGGGQTPRRVESTDKPAPLSKGKLQSARDTLREIVGDAVDSLNDAEIGQFCRLVTQRHDIGVVSSLFDEQKADVKSLFQEVYGDRAPASAPRLEKPDSKSARIAPRSEPKQAKIRPRSMKAAPEQSETVDDVLQAMCKKGGPLHGISKPDYVVFGRRLLREGVNLYDTAAVAAAYKEFKDHRTETRRPRLGDIGKTKPFVRGEIGRPQPRAEGGEIGRPQPLAEGGELGGTALMKAIGKGSGKADILALLNAPKKQRSDPSETVPGATKATNRVAEELERRANTLVQDLRYYDALSPEEKADKRANPNPTEGFFSALTTVVTLDHDKPEHRNALTFSIAEDAEGGFDAICIWVEQKPKERASLLRTPDSRGERPLTTCLHDILATTDDKRIARQEGRFARLLDLGAGVICAPSPLLIALNKRPDLAITLLEKSGVDSASFLKELKKAHGQNKAERVQGLISTCEALAACCANEDPAFAPARKEAGAQLALFISKLATKCDAFEIAEILGKPWFDGLPKDQQKALLDRFAKRLPGDIADSLKESGTNPATLGRCLTLLSLARDYKSPAEDKGWNVLVKEVGDMPWDLKKKASKKPLWQSITETMKTTKILVDLYQHAPKKLQPRFSAAPLNLSHFAMARMTDKARATMLQKLESENSLAGLIDAGRMTVERAFSIMQQTLADPPDDYAYVDGQIMMIFDSILPAVTLAKATGDSELITLLRRTWGLLSVNIQNQFAKNEIVSELKDLLKRPPTDPDM